MGSASCRLSSSNSQKPLSGDDTHIDSHCNSLTKHRRLQRTVAKAKDVLQHKKAPNFLINNTASGDSALGLQSRASGAGQGASRRSQRRNMEIIEIPDDVGDNEVISLGSLSGERESSIASDVDFISNSSSQIERDAEDDPLSERSIGAPARARAAVDDDLWGYEIPKPRPGPEPDLWAQDILRPNMDIAAALHQFGQREPDWREFLEDGSPIAENQHAVHAHTGDIGQSNIQDIAPLDFPHALIDQKVECVDDVLSVFPDICRDYVSELYDNGVGEIAEQLVAHILDKLDNHSDYPKAKDKLRTLKRKREVDEDEEAANKYGSIDRENGSHDYSTLTRSILSGEFVYTPMVFIDLTLKETRNHLFPAYLILEEAERNWDLARSPYTRIKKPRTSNPYWTPDTVEATLSRDDSTADTMLALRELQAVRRVRKKADDKRQADRQAKLDEEENIKRAEAEGTMLECGCCFGDYPLNRMVHCDDDYVPHWFCKGCAKQTAETEIGNSKYKVKCMSMEGCQAGFSRDMKAQFLDEKLSIALDRNEQEEMLRLAGIENLASCPFCPFAAEYPPVEEDREFRCQAPDCERISCRLCNLASHIPKTCEESAKENGLSVRRQIEEAMSAAIIRTCNKCGTPFIKEEGCNKMTCTRSGCYNVQCYVCSKSCSYDHFNDRSRGGKLGNCPLFESVEERHQEEVKKAEKEALEKVRAEHPEYTEEDLKVKVSENVRKDEERRKANDPRNLPPLIGVAQRMPPAGVFQQQARARGHHRHRAEPRHAPPQPIAQGFGPWPPIGAPPRWHYDGEDGPPPIPGVDQKAEVPDPIVWHREVVGDVQQDLQPHQMIPEPPVWHGAGVQYPPPGPFRAFPEPPRWHYRPDVDIQYNDGFDLMLGFLPPPDGPDPAAGVNRMAFGGAERGYQYMPAPLGEDAPNDDVLYGVYDGGLPNMELDRLRLRHQEGEQIQAPQQRPARLPRGQPVAPQAGIALRLPRGNAF